MLDLTNSHPEASLSSSEESVACMRWVVVNLAKGMKWTKEFQQTKNNREHRNTLNK